MSYDNWRTTDPHDNELGRSSGTPEPYRCLDCPWRGRGFSAAVAHYWAHHGEHTVKPASDPRCQTAHEKAKSA